jgi:hypothetical protein
MLYRLQAAPSHQRPHKCGTTSKKVRYGVALWESRAEGSERVPRPALPGPSARPSR